MPVAERVVGHICISGPSLMSGYFGDQASQDEIAATGWLDTGDLGYLLDGYLYVTGRIKDLIIIRGRNIWPQDIEYIAEQEPEIHSGDAIAFVTAQEKIILQIQCRISDEERRGQLPPASLPVRKRKNVIRRLMLQAFMCRNPWHESNCRGDGRYRFYR